MNLTEQQRRDIIPELESILNQATEVRRKLYYVVERFNNDIITAPASNLSYRFTSELGDALDALKRSGEAYIEAGVTSWYMALHYDMSDPIKEVPEHELHPPTYESVVYLGENKWEVIMQTETHGKEQIIVYSDSCTSFDVYSSNKIINGVVTED